MGDIVTRPHRSTLGDVATLATKLGKSSGLAVAYEPGIGYVLLGGERRFGAHQHRGDRNIEVYLIESWFDWHSWMVKDHESAAARGFERVPLDIVSAAYLDLKARHLLKPSPTRDRAVHDMAEYTGHHKNHLQHARYLVTALEAEENDEARRLIQANLAEMKAGKIGPYGAWERYARFRRRAANPGKSGDEQRKTLTNAANLMAGVTDGLAGLGDLSPDLTAGECAVWANQLAATARQLARTIRMLKERDAP